MRLHLCYFSRKVDGRGGEHDLARRVERPLHAAPRRRRGRGRAARAAGGREREDAVVAHGPRERRAQARAHAALDLNKPALDEAARRGGHDVRREADQLVRRGAHALDYVHLFEGRLVGRWWRQRRRSAHRFDDFGIGDWAFHHLKQCDPFEALLQMRLNSQWIGRFRQNLQQLVVRQKEESKVEHTSTKTNLQKYSTVQ